MSIDTKTISYVADLARIDISESEASGLTNDLGGILAYVDQIQAIAKGLSDSGKEHILINNTSPDVVQNTPGVYSEDILNEAPGREGDYVLVKKVL